MIIVHVIDVYVFIQLLFCLFNMHVCLYECEENLFLLKEATDKRLIVHLKAYQLCLVLTDNQNFLINNLIRRNR